MTQRLPVEAAPISLPLTPSARALRAVLAAQRAAAEAVAGLLGPEHRVARQASALVAELERIAAGTERRARIAGAVERFVERRTA